MKGDSADPHIGTALNLLKQLAKLSSKNSREPCAQSISDQSACSLSAPSNSQYACSEQTYANRSSFPFGALQIINVSLEYEGLIGLEI